MKNAQSNKVTKESSEEDTVSNASSLDQSSITSDGLNDKIYSNEPSISSNNSSRSSSPKSFAVVSNEYSINNQFNSDKSTSDDQQKYMLTTAQPSYHPEVLIDGHLMRWPRFGIKEAIFRGRSYTLTNTCHIDSALFALYFYI
ncbi:unnamed protein product [Rotaria sordida]|uniref:Uncharacterized protein n=1 Tax=Rotaria sordida TaxID=392033 RepID=A0A814ENE0_9BILA|nr:unnamed protein product [Rotaria sordida]CAF3818068.1 unnamed protein product [Rotaria sordida]CAF3963264.1 unnamed protein product [Rotaria sordida]